eukprot:scaffold221629_cov20-Prasinocladus_malaysianus.AAC.2
MYYGWDYDINKYSGNSSCDLVPAIQRNTWQQSEHMIISRPHKPKWPIVSQCQTPDTAHASEIEAQITLLSHSCEEALTRTTGDSDDPDVTAVYRCKCMGAGVRMTRYTRTDAATLKQVKNVSRETYTR